MKIDDERLREFQEAYQQDFGEAISLDAAREMLSRVVTLYTALRRPLPSEDKRDAPTPPIDPDPSRTAPEAS